MDRPLCKLCGKNLAKKLISRHGKVYYTKECNTCRRLRYKLEGRREHHPCFPVALLPPGEKKNERLRLQAILKKKGGGGHRSNSLYRRYVKDSCERCGFIPEDYCQLQVHHLDHNHSNNDLSNLQTLCANCHSLHHKRNTIK